MSEASDRGARTAEETLAFVNANVGGHNKALGFYFTSVSAEETRGELTITEAHHQPFGIVHGGIYASLVETACSTGAALFAFGNGQSIVGLENSTSFLRAVRTGTLTVVAKPLARGRKTQVWEASIYDEKGTVAATGRLRLLCLDGGTEVAGAQAKPWGT
jgi:1,4-dihydroxy-2-naphthoyl-CoA hydrolase